MVFALLVALGAALLARSSSPSILASLGAPGVYSGVLQDGSLYEFQLPTHWNGILFLYSHGYVVKGDLNPAVDAGDIYTGAWLLDHGYAVAGSSFASAGWDVAQAETDQKDLLLQFSAITGRSPSEVIAWGHSLGGLITVELAQLYPNKIAGAVSFCGVVSGGAPIWNVDLAAMVAIKKLLGPKSKLQLVNITHPSQNLALAESLVNNAQKSPSGRARIALVAAIDGIPGWYNPSSSQPNSVSAQERAQYQWLTINDLPFFADYRAELEKRAGGNFSTDVGFNFSTALLRSPSLSEVRQLYDQAGLRLTSDLNELSKIKPIYAGNGPSQYLERYSAVSGKLSIPLLTMHTTGDGLVPDSTESVLKQLVSSQGDQSMLRQLTVSRAGHCTFSASETIVALKAMLYRIHTGRWPNLSPSYLNSQADEFSSTYNKFTTVNGSFFTKPDFVKTQPPPFPM